MRVWGALLALGHPPLACAAVRPRRPSPPRADPPAACGLSLSRGGDRSTHDHGRPPKSETEATSHFALWIASTSTCRRPGVGCRTEGQLGEGTTGPRDTRVYLDPSRAKRKPDPRRPEGKAGVISWARVAEADRGRGGVQRGEFKSTPPRAPGSLTGGCAAKGPRGRAAAVGPHRRRPGPRAADQGLRSCLCCGSAAGHGGPSGAVCPKRTPRASGEYTPAPGGGGEVRRFVDCAADFRNGWYGTLRTGQFLISDRRLNPKYGTRFSTKHKAVGSPGGGAASGCALHCARTGAHNVG